MILYVYLHDVKKLCPAFQVILIMQMTPCGDEQFRSQTHRTRSKKCAMNGRKGSFCFGLIVGYALTVTTQNKPIMLLRNVRIASRFLLKHRQYTGINLFGFTLSLVCVLFIGLYVHDELSFDRFHGKASRIYRVTETETSAEGVTTQAAGVPFQVATLEEQLPSIEKSTRIVMFGRFNLINPENQQNKIYESFTAAEQSFFDVFDFKVAYGTLEGALREPNTAVLTRSTAERLFGTSDAVGKLIDIEEDQLIKVTAVLEDFPSNSHLSFNVIFSMASITGEDWFKEEFTNDWTSNSFSTYIVAKDETDTGALANAITATVNKNRDAETSKTTFGLQALADIHFGSAGFRGGLAQNPGEIYYVYIFSAVGIFILLIACINYINLSTSLSITRGKEVGVKKVAGAARHNLIGQFICEANIISIGAMILALGIVNLLIPNFNAFVGKQIPADLLWEPRVLVALIIFILLTGLLSGSYPAFYLSKFKPALAIKGASLAGGKSPLRQVLVVFQFALSIVLILATLIAQQQLSFVRNADLGFREDQLVVLDINSGLTRRGFETIKNEIAKIPVVKEVCVTSRVPGEWKNIPQVGITTPGTETKQDLYFIGADADFLRTFEVSLLTGRNFSDNNPADSSSFLINETAAKQLGIVDPLNVPVSIERVNYSVNFRPLEQPFKGKIIGVVKDFHFQSLHQKIAPLLIAYRNNPIHSIDYFSVRMEAGDWQAALKDMEKALHLVDPGQILEYNFLDEKLANFYRQDTKRGQLFTIATVVSICLACMGLFSLVSFMTEQRRKEIGIRKALGASVSQIVTMISSSYLRLVLLGFLLATPLAILALDQWLQTFAYRVDIGLVTIVVACGLSLLIAFLTVGYKSFKAAWENPVKSLRNE